MPDLPRNPTPRAEFQANSANIQRHAKLLDNSHFQYALQTALAEYARDLTTGISESDFNAQAAAHLKLRGAQRFVDLLLNLAEPQIRPKVTPLSQNLKPTP